MALTRHAAAATDALLEGFIDGEFARLDTDGSDGLTLEEFTHYVTSMTRWMRDELAVESNARSVFALLSSKAVEVSQPAVDVPPSLDDDDNSDVYFDASSSRWVVDTRTFGIRVEIPKESLIPGARLAVRTLACSSVAYLESGAAAGQAEFAFTPVVRIDYPAFGGGYEMPPLGGKLAPKFRSPLTLIVPHCFEPNEGEESCRFLGTSGCLRAPRAPKQRRELPESRLWLSPLL